MASSSSLLDEFNSVSVASFPETKKPRDLVEGKSYPVHEIHIAKTKFGDAAVATLEEEAGEDLVNVFLPKRITKMLQTQDLEVFKSKKYKLTFTDIKELSPTVHLSEENKE